MIKPKPLQPKPKIINTHPLLEHRVTAARLGWTQNPCTLKGKPCKRWNRIACDETAILALPDWRDPHWQGTAVRVVGNLAVYDSDVTIPEIADLILDDLFELNPDAYNSAIMRDSGGVTLALFFRTAVPFRQLKTRVYTAHPELIAELAAAHLLPETNEEEHEAKISRLREITAALEPQKIEIYGPLAKGRYFQYEGPHSEGRDYHCGVRAPWNTAVADLPLLPLTPGDLIDRADTILAQHLTVIPELQDAAGDVVYDLTPETLFYPKGGEPESIEDLAIGLTPGAENGLYGCLPSTLASSRSGANCKLYVSSTSGRVIVTNWANDGRRHYMATDAPPPRSGLSEAARAVMAALQPPESELQSPPVSHTRDGITRGATDQETHDNARDWLLEHVAYYPEAFKGRGGVISIHADGEFRVPLTMLSLRAAMASYGWIEIGERGGEHPHNPVGAWSAHPSQVMVHGVRMRPELPRPLFKEDGLLLINRYEPPCHPSKGGTITEFLDRLVALIPDEVEREWFVNWLAWKIQNPHCRGVGVAMIARDNGSGRGLLAETMQLALGEQFVVSMPYANVSGGSKFNAEVEGRLMLYVNEAAPPESRKFANKNATREALKVFIEPNHRIPFRVEPKGVDAYFTRAAISTMIFTNNIDGLPLDEADRRVTVIINGPQMTAEEIDRYNAWMAVPANIGALYRYLCAHKVDTDKSRFDPYMAPHFHGRDLMIDAGKTLIDRAWDMAVDKLRGAAELYAMSQVVALTRHFARKYSNSDFDDLVEKHTIVNGYRIGVKHGKNWLVRFNKNKTEDSSNKADDNRERVYAHDDKGRRKWTKCDTSDIRKQLYLAQEAVDKPAKDFASHLKLIKK